MWANSLWRIRLRTGALNLWVPLPLHVIRELMQEFEDLGALILPRLNLPNYPAGVRSIVEAILAADGHGTVIDIDTEDVHIVIGPAEGGT